MFTCNFLDSNDFLFYIHFLKVYLLTYFCPDKDPWIHAGNQLMPESSLVGQGNRVWQRVTTRVLVMYQK
jgi:hypothetical protein